MRQRLASILGLSLAALCAAAPQANAQPPSVTGTWVNDHGSVLVIQSIGANGSVTGTYANNAAGYKCAGCQRRSKNASAGRSKNASRLTA